MSDIVERLRRLYVQNGTNYVQEAADEIERLRADAERYRWLRGDSCLDHSIRWAQWEVRRWDAPQWTGDLRRADLDAAIDAARGKE